MLQRAAIRVLDEEGRFLAPARDNQKLSFWRPRNPKVANPTLKQQLFAVFNDPRSSPAAFVYVVFLIATILLSLVSLFISSLPKYWLDGATFLFLIETVCAVIFTLDYIVRLLTAPKWYKWIIKPYPIIDFVSTTPYYIELIVERVASRTPVIRVLRVFRVLRVLKLGRFSENFTILTRTFIGSLDGLFMLVFLFLIGISLFSSALFFAEQTGSFFDKNTKSWYRNDDGTVSPFQDIPHCMWYAMVSMTTLGYGDAVPVTALGKIVGAMTMIYGIFMLAFPITLLGSRFHLEWKLYEEEQRVLMQQHVVRHEKTFDELLGVLQQHIVDITDLYEMIDDKIKSFEANRGDLEKLLAEVEKRAGSMSSAPSADIARNSATANSMQDAKDKETIDLYPL